MRFVYNDGGRAAAGYTGTAGDCGVRAVAIALGIPYKEAYNDLRETNRFWAATKKSDVAKSLQKKGPSPRNGVFREVMDHYLIHERGWCWIPTASIGQRGIHLRSDELPTWPETGIARVSKHYVAFTFDSELRRHAVHDINPDVTRRGTRLVYGIWSPGYDNDWLDDVEASVGWRPVPKDEWAVAG